MRYLLVALLSALSLTTMANNTLKVNKENCNLPMSKIRKLIPEKAAQEKMRYRCMEKSGEERWKN